MADFVAKQTSSEMSTIEYPRKLLRAATYESVMPSIKRRKRLLSEQNEYQNLVTQLSNDKIYPNKKSKTEWYFDDAKDDNHSVLCFSSLSSFENTINCSPSTSYQRRKSFTYINDPSYSQLTSVLQTSTTTTSMLVCQQKLVIDNNNENEQGDKSNSSNLITSAQVSAYITTAINMQNENLLIIDCGSPLRYNERRIKESLLLNINDKLSKKRLISRGLKNFLDQNQLNRLNQSEIIILYDDSIQRSSCSCSCSNSTVPKEISPIMKCILNEIQRYDSKKIVYILQSSFDEFYQYYPTFCYISLSDCPDNDISYASLTTDIESYTMSEVIPGLYLGNAQDAEDMNLLKQNDIKSIINISTSIPCHYANEKIFDYLQLPCYDSCRENILQYFDHTLEYIHQKLLLNQNILVHCQGGVSRSPSFVIGYLIKYHSKTFDQAYSFTKEKRKIINPNFYFLTQLKRYEQTIQSAMK
ncbi:unnamed protein product [Rotaria socialis]|uniref:protein-tyrosine-phosphatase n=1 Tax=Rotaria socialis TaxID=392032 RepID=A0A820UBI5_9BILA|nr:unnamed protein product [Rotaria socialis]CAF3715079.1 unnamed protein product [Rotaria socialis]CAF4267324.1 unnamed protein product [Rotaria socialis]CAF4484041.1 unnamed protein product [Rotaria socialis]